MPDKFNERANALAAEYWRLKGVGSTVAGTADGTGTAAEKNAENKLADLEEIEKLLEQGVGGKLRAKLDAEARRLRREKEERSSASQGLVEVRKELLELTAEFAPNLDLFDGRSFPYDSEHEPISEDYFSAITDLFLGKPQPSVQLKNAVFSKDGVEIRSETAGAGASSSSSSALKVLGDLIMLMQETAKKLLGTENSIDRACKMLRQNEYAFIVLRTLVRDGKGNGAGRRLRMRQIKEISYNEDKEYKELVRNIYDKELVKGVEYLLSGKWEHELVRAHDGEHDDREYEPTDFGVWVWRICNAEFESGGARVGKRRVWGERRERGERKEKGGRREKKEKGERGDRGERGNKGEREEKGERKSISMKIVKFLKKEKIK